MQLDLFRHLWGYVGTAGEPFATVESALPTIRDGGYAGVEAPLSFFPDPERTAASISDAGLDLIHMAIVFGESVDDHVHRLEQELDRAASMPHRFVNCHGGRDAWSDDDAFRFYDRALRAADTRGVDIVFETHRGRPTYNPWTTDRIIARFPELQLTADLSHWVVVCERIIDDQLDVIERVADRTRHIHARVGFDNGPQVNDPRAPEHAATLAAHERWWDTIWRAQERRGIAATTMTPEFGPPTYQQTEPGTLRPLADLAAVVDWMSARQRDRFGRRSPG